VFVHLIPEKLLGKELWSRQDAALQEIGLRFSFAKLVKTGFLVALGLFLNPGLAAKKYRLWASAQDKFMHNITAPRTRIIER